MFVKCICSVADSTCFHHLDFPGMSLFKARAKYWAAAHSSFRIAGTRVTRCRFLHLFLKFWCCSVSTLLGSDLWKSGGPLQSVSARTQIKRSWEILQVSSFVETWEILQVNCLNRWAIQSAGVDRVAEISATAVPFWLLWSPLGLSDSSGPLLSVRHQWQWGALNLRTPGKGKRSAQVFSWVINGNTLMCNLLTSFLDKNHMVWPMRFGPDAPFDL